MKIRPVTVLKCIVYPTIAVASGLLCSCDRTEAPKVPKEQPGQQLGGDPCIEQLGQKLGGDPCIEQPEQRLAGEVAEPRIGAKSLSAPTANDKVRQVEELQKQAEKREREALEESGVVTPPAATDTESEAADSEPHS
ncbi:MAG: hypothetical protein ACI4OX_01740 [Akkermansia sp.]